jgi:single-stranded-DNA-specific exonuclease
MDVFINLFTTFVQKREHHFTDEDHRDLQLVALGTLADIMPLKDENRILVRCGMAALNKRAQPGIQELLVKLELDGRRIGATEVGWKICPAINSAGRMGRPDEAAALLLEDDPREREKRATAIKKMNEERKDLGEQVWPVVEPLAAESLAEFDGKLVLAAGEDIYRGISGIMASRLVGRFKVPALVVSFGEQTATGSLRSARGYDLRGLLDQCSDLFIDWGGHNYAAGFSLYRKDWDTFRERLKNAARSIELGEDQSEETVTVDAELPQVYMTPDVFTLVDRFEPYGEGNEPLIFMAKGLKVMDLSFMGKVEVKHVKLTLDAGKHKWPAVYWSAAEKVKRDFDLNDAVDVVFTVQRNFFNGIETPQLVIKDLRRSAAGN